MRKNINYTQNHERKSERCINYSCLKAVFLIPFAPRVIQNLAIVFLILLSRSNACVVKLQPKSDKNVNTEHHTPRAASNRHYRRRSIG